MRVMLAPMEGVLDAFVRELLTDINDYDLCVTEFVRVVNTLLPKKTFYRLSPELLRGGKTASGTPVRVQLLGSSPEWMAENAARAVELGSSGIDINCGCPAKNVVGSDGGASLLKKPETIYQVTKAVRAAVPAGQTLSVKVRLGWDSIDRRFDIADAVQQGGADEIVVHGRTKEDGYKAERIDWRAIGDIRERLTIPVIANGEIWSYEDGQRCIEQSGCEDLMVGRGALNVPNLGSVVKHRAAPLPWPQALALLKKYVQTENPHDTGHYNVARTKQWLGYLKKAYPQADELFSVIRTVKDAPTLSAILLAA
ncbi:tRNA-dihydrouridine(16) synthase [Leminorella grimontii]|uniref:tRNA-dihydrouridine(16) synthase n=1 Tax=Leminorella grimontii TaxID=82981 RepID=A0AAV5MX02_9GAMM|nr:tRNA dihydrouridine(16) synthase DusC [Leminorella grimontii]KFC96438.1 tRNA-dihydrouridine synthase C [Leminorella grimontii ATCC 33999 = DSM 5078]GKX54373.1 tRNA-dihydrouridine(16) synthase [Leminorella grimontii]VFS59458.1 Probable tRNA-dihydrouridine synthase [Leminorella grimontii]